MHIAIANRWIGLLGNSLIPQTRRKFLHAEVQTLSHALSALALNELVRQAMNNHEIAKNALHFVVDWLIDVELADIRIDLETLSTVGSLTHLSLLLGTPFLNLEKKQSFTKNENEIDEQQKIPDYGRGRPLTLGERKSLARRPPASLLMKLLEDPHPDVIRQLLSSSNLSEDHVLRLVVRRPNEESVLREVAKHPRWSQRSRLRTALLMHPETPLKIALPMLALLTHQEHEGLIEESSMREALRQAAICYRARSFSQDR